MDTVNVKLFGRLHTIAGERGTPVELDVEIPEEGMAAVELLALLDLPAEVVEGVFVNHKVYPVSHTVLRGDQVAFVPKGVPGPHRFTLGLFSAGQANRTSPKNPRAE